MHMGIREISQRLTHGFEDIERRAVAVPDTSHLAAPIPDRIVREESTDDEALSFIPIFRAIQILTTATEQMPLEQHRGQSIVANTANLLKSPDYNIDRDEWIQTAILSLAFNGNLFLKLTRNQKNEVINAQVLPPVEVAVVRDPISEKITYWHKGKVVPASDIVHRKFLAMPGALRGMGPIQVARKEITGALDVRDYATGWFKNSKQPSGLLTGASIETGDQAAALQEFWNQTVNDPDNISGIRVLGGDLNYEPLFLSPEDAQWLDVRKFTVTDFARLFGIPSALMLVSLDGNSLTYSNVEQEWVAFIRFTLTKYLRSIESALSEILPLGTKARFNIEGLLRADTRSRYDSYQVGISAGFMTINQVRELEGWDPITTESQTSE